MFSTAHKHLLVPLASAPHSAYQVGVAPQETPRHSWDLVGYVKYVSRTLPGGSQLCKECTLIAAGQPATGRTRQGAGEAGPPVRPLRRRREHLRAESTGGGTGDGECEAFSGAQASAHGQ